MDRRDGRRFSVRKRRNRMRLTRASAASETAKAGNQDDKVWHNLFEFIYFMFLVNGPSIVIKYKKKRVGSEVPPQSPSKKAKKAQVTDDDKDKKKSVSWAIGDKVPDLELRNQRDEPVSLQTLCKDCGIIVFLYPKANTPVSIRHSWVSLELIQICE
jgi:hypothetical protein